MKNTLFVFMAAIAFVPTVNPAQSAESRSICLPPEEPYVPADDNDFREYADIVATEFDRYFKEITDYFTCMDGTRRAVFDQAREVSKAHQAFWRRVDTLGVVKRAAASSSGSAVGP